MLERRCLGCHFFEGKGSGEQTASDLAHFGSRAWVRGLLEKPASPTYFGKVAKFDGMAEWKKSSKLEPKQLDDVADFVASFAAIPDDMTHRRLGQQPRRVRPSRARTVSERVRQVPRRSTALPRAACAMPPSSSAGDLPGGSPG